MGANDGETKQQSGITGASSTLLPSITTTLASASVTARLDWARDRIWILRARAGVRRWRPLVSCFKGEQETGDSPGLSTHS